MRNLKKILALVLALVMSLSLMATAGATDFTDADSISDVFQESVDVLNGLKVFQGYEDGAFRPDTPIKRSEVAVIIYRIATGDVEDSQVGIYKDYNKFKDVTGSHWAAGYINYCANAEYIKGVSSTKFEPEEYVTGYQALAMILRAIGYDKNGEFTGRDWHIQTAATARQRGVIENIAEGLLGQAATREMVAEILCKTILVDEVAYTPAFGYQIQEGKTLAYDTFKMEKLTGVVMANEYANLNVDGSSPLPAGRTELVTFDGDSYTMNAVSGRDDLGESRYVYVVPDKNHTTRYDLVVEKTYDTGLNNVYGKDMNEESGAATTVSAAAASKSITGVADADHFINYDQATEWTARIRIRYVMDINWTDYEAYTMLSTNNGTLTPILTVDGSNNPATFGTPITTPPTASSNWSNVRNNNMPWTYRYEKVIALGAQLTDQDMANLRSIFRNADNRGSTILGLVNTGTWSTTSTSTTVPDVSDEMRWEDFVAVNLETRENRKQVESNGLGQTLKIIDNDNDHVADYVLQTIYTVGKIASNGTSLTNVNQMATDGDEVNNVTTQPIVMEDGSDPVVGDVVIYAVIDGNIRAQKAETETVKINTVNRAGRTATATGEDGKTWNQSAVHPHVDGLAAGVTGMVGNTTYTLYFDLYGNIAAYTEGSNGGLVLITNGWYNNTISGPEYAVQAYVDGKLQTVNVTTNGGLFINNNVASSNTWSGVKNGFGGGSINNQGSAVTTIVANLDGSILTPVDKAYLYSQRLRVLDMKSNVIPGRDNSTTSWGTPYQTNYANSIAYNVTGVDAGDSAPAADGTYEVRGLSNTEYYVVYRAIGTDSVTGDTNVVVRKYVGYSSLPNINRSYIEDVYAIGAKATATTSSGPVTYYTAQVVVIECNNKYTGHMSDSEQVFIPDFAEVSSNIGIENVTMIRGNGEKVTVQVDMSQSQIDWYDPAGGTTARLRVPGLYFMDPSDSNPDVYVVRRMSPEDVRANNYMAGFVRESYDTLTNNYAQIEMRVRPNGFGPDGVNASSGANVYNYRSGSFFLNNAAAIPGTPADADGILAHQSKAVTSSSKTYTYGGSSASLTEAAADIVLTEDRRLDDAGTTLTALNEKWTGAPTGDLGNMGLRNRNEVLVRYDNSGNVIWAVSFLESSTTAQEVWWNYLPTATANTSILFWNNADGGVNDTTPAGDKQITIKYSAAAGPIVDLTSIAASITSYRLYKWDAVNSTWNLLDAAGEDAQKPDPTSDQTYRLEITLNTGAIETYYLKQLAQVSSGTLGHTDANKIKVVSAPNNAFYTSEDAAKAAAANKATIWVDNPANTDISQLETYLTYIYNTQPGTVEVVYVDNGKGSVLTKDKTIEDALDFGADGNQTVGTIVIKVTNYDNVSYYVQLHVQTGAATSEAGMTPQERKDRVKTNLWTFIQKQAADQGVPMSVIEADTGIKGEKGSAGNGIMREYELFCQSVDGMPTDSNAALSDIDLRFRYDAAIDAIPGHGVTEAYTTSVKLGSAYTDWSFVDARDGTPYGTGGFTSQNDLKTALIHEIGALKTEQSGANTTEQNNILTLRTAALAQITGTTAADQAKKDTIESICNKAYDDIGKATSKAEAEALYKAADKAVRDVLAPSDATTASKYEVAAETKGDPYFDGIESYVEVGLTATQTGATIKLSGTVTTSFNATAWNAGPATKGFAQFNNIVSVDPGNQVGKYGISASDITKMAIIPIKYDSGSELALIVISDGNAAYAKAHPGETYKVHNFGGGFEFDLDLSDVTFN